MGSARSGLVSCWVMGIITVLSSSRSSHGMARIGMRERLVSEAIDYLFVQAKAYPEHEKTLLSHALRYSRRHRVPLPAARKREFCKACLHIYGSEARRRVVGESLRITCDRCGQLRRLKIA